MFESVAIARKPRSKSVSRSVWPLPHHQGLNPTVIGRSLTDPGSLAVDIGYSGTDLSRRTFVPVFAVQDGVIAHVETTNRGHAITIDHDGWCTSYSELEHVFVLKSERQSRRRPRVRAGDVLGYVRIPVQVRFELWQLDDDDDLVPVDPQPHLHQWLTLPDLEQAPRNDQQPPRNDGIAA